MLGREGFRAQVDVRPDLFNACRVRHKKNGNVLKDFVVAENGEVDWTSSIGCFSATDVCHSRDRPTWQHVLLPGHSKFMLTVVAHGLKLALPMLFIFLPLTSRKVKARHP